MTALDYTRKKQRLVAFEQLARNEAFTAELLPQFERHLEDALSGLRNRNASREKRDEYLQAAEDAEALTRFVARRMADLRKELAIPPEDCHSGDDIGS